MNYYKKYLKYKNKYINLLNGGNENLIDYKKFQPKKIILTIKFMSGDIINIECDMNTTIRSIIENKNLLKERTFVELHFNKNFVKELKIPDYKNILDLDETVGYYINKGLILIQIYDFESREVVVFNKQIKLDEYKKNINNLQELLDPTNGFNIYSNSVESIKIELNGIRIFKKNTRLINKPLSKYIIKGLDLIKNDSFEEIKKVFESTEFQKVLEDNNTNISNFLNLAEASDQNFLLTEALKRDRFSIAKYLLENGAIPRNSRHETNSFEHILKNKLQTYDKKINDKKTRKILEEIKELADEKIKNEEMSRELIKKYKIKKQYMEYKNNIRYIQYVDNIRTIQLKKHR